MSTSANYVTLQTMQTIGASSGPVLEDIINDHLIHYGINLGDSDIVINRYGFDQPIKRGVLFPINKRAEWGDNADWDEQGKIIHPVTKCRLYEFSPGVIARYISRGDEDTGVLIIKALTGCTDYRVIAELTEVLNFANKKEGKETIFTTNSEASANIIAYLEDNEITSGIIYEALKECLTKLEANDNYIFQHMGNQRQGIKDGTVRMLDNRDLRMCKAAGLDASDYDISGDASKFAQKDMLKELKKLAVQDKNVANDIAVVELQKENKALKDSLVEMQANMAKLMAMMEAKQEPAKPARPTPAAKPEPVKPVTALEVKENP